jgi:hypothetical protein
MTAVSRDLPGQLLMPWGDHAAVDAAAVAAVEADVPQHAERCSTLRAAEALHVSERTVRNMIEAGTLLASRANSRVDSLRNDWRVVVRAGRPFDPARKTMMTLEEAVKIFTNIGG